MSKTHKKFELSPRLKFAVGRGYTQNKILKASAIICLILALGLSFNAFKLIFSSGATSIAQDVLTPKVLGASDSKAEDMVNPVQFADYKVLKGDTLFNISQKYNISWTVLATINNLKSPFTLKAGQIIQIPK